LPISDSIFRFLAFIFISNFLIPGYYTIALIKSLPFKPTKKEEPESFS